MSNLQQSIPIQNRITRVFELKPGADPYATILRLKDHHLHGYTIGWAGFTTANEEVVACVNAYTQRVGSNHLSADILQELKRLRDAGSGDTNGLDRLEFKKHWSNAASTIQFQEAFEEVVQELFGLPAQSHCNVLGLKSAVAKAIFFDTVIQLGEDGHPDSLGAIIERVHQKRGHDLEEIAFLLAFLVERRKTLLHPSPENADAATDWAQSVSRTYAFERLVLWNRNLKLPVRIKSNDYDERLV